MKTKKVEIILGKDGSIKVEAFGFKGESCEEATMFLDRIFGKAKNKKVKNSYFEEKQSENLIDGLPSGYCG